MGQASLRSESGLYAGRLPTILRLGGSATRTVGPVAVESGHAPLDALAKAGKTAVLEDRIVHGAHFAVVQHDIGAAEAAWNIIGLPRPKRDFLHPAIACDPQLGIPERAFLV